LFQINRLALLSIEAEPIYAKQYPLPDMNSSGMTAQRICLAWRRHTQAAPK
jgi:hypothetical protein